MLNNNNQKKKMLIVDDVETNRVILSLIFNDDYDILEADNGKNALEILKKDDISIIILDINMPVMNGYELLKQMNELNLISNIPVIVVTEMKYTENELKAFDLGASDMIVKPFDSRVIKKRVNNIMSKREMDKILAENKLLLEYKQTQIQLQTLIRNVPGGVVEVILNNELDITYYNDGFKEFFMDSTYLEEVIKKGLAQTILKKDIKEILYNINKSIEDKIQWQQAIKITKNNGTIGWYLISGREIFFEEGKHVRLLCVIIDISNEKEQESQLRFLAQFDQLTKIYNKVTFYNESNEMIKSNYDIEYILIKMNVNKLKIINEMFNTNTGDELLITVANGLTNFIHNKGTYGRVEGDNFAICIPNTPGIVDQFIDYMNEYISKSFKMYNVTLRYATYVVNDKSLSINVMSERLGFMLDDNENIYGEKYQVYDEKILQTVFANQQISNEMNQALINKDFQVVIQPIYQLNTNKLISGEALVRWKHPIRGVISPEDFIPIFESNGFIQKLDFYMVEEACITLDKWKSKGHKIVPISVNISRITIYNPSFMHKLTSIIEKYDIPIDYIRLEITESAYSINEYAVQKILNELHKHGFKILMDDFGSGYSSLNALKDSPIDILKLDMKFIQEYDKSHKSRTIIESVIKMSKTLDIPVIAEGVETIDQVEFLLEVNCDRVQGYYFSKPIDIMNFEKLL